MNWFERYAIPGAYLTLLLSWLSYIVFNLKIEEFENIDSIIAAVFVAMIPVAGYLLVTLSQRLYYCGVLPVRGFNSKMWKTIKDDKNECDYEIESESDAEAKSVYYARCDNPLWNNNREKYKDVDKDRFFHEWLSKRADVIAINSAIFVANIIGLLFYLIFNCLCSNCVCLSKIKYWLIVVGITSLISCSSSNLLFKQARLIATEYFKYLERKKSPSNDRKEQNESS